jgi:hypothetical protein
VGRTEVPGTLADVVNCTHWTDYSETDNFSGQTSLYNKSAISPSHILTARMLCDGGGRCIGRNAKSVEQVVGKRQEVVASSAAAGTEVCTVTINKYLVTALPGLTAYSQPPNGFSFMKYNLLFRRSNRSGSVTCPYRVDG